MLAAVHFGGESGGKSRKRRLAWNGVGRSLPMSFVFRFGLGFMTSQSWEFGASPPRRDRRRTDLQPGR
jgi:hypothetical protein